ncbi:MAG: hypothetical protein GY866_37390 [Proteobacteria bacterium]|nr:hypothetical protein [Pseudomonadota bacterium]
MPWETLSKHALPQSRYCRNPNLCFHIDTEEMETSVPAKQMDSNQNPLFIGNAASPGGAMDVRCPVPGHGSETIDRDENETRRIETALRQCER